MSCYDTSDSVQQYFSTPVAEGGACAFTGYLIDAAGNELTLIQLDSITATLYDQATEDIIGARDHQNIKNTNGGTVANVVVEGVPRLRFTLALSGADHVIVSADDPPPLWETHVALIEWSYDGSIPGKKEISFSVQNMALVP